MQMSEHRDKKIDGVGPENDKIVRVSIYIVVFASRSVRYCRSCKQSTAADIRRAFNKFPDFFVLAFKIVVDS